MTETFFASVIICLSELQLIIVCLCSLELCSSKTALFTFISKMRIKWPFVAGMILLSGVATSRYTFQLDYGLFGVRLSLIYAR